MEDVIKQLKKESKDTQKQMGKVEQIINTKDKMIEQIEADYKRMQSDLKGYKERCKDYERELEGLMQVENNNLFGNAQTSGGSGTQLKKYDVEIKQIKDQYTQ